MSAESSPSRSESASALAPGTRLHEFELQKVLGIGGFGIVYQAFDHALEREVAIKEYMPASLVGRTETLRVSLRSAADGESFALGLKSFVNEAKLLARFDHPSLLKVYRYWEDNGTAYMAMPVLRGRTLKEMRSSVASRIDEAWLRQILLPLLGAIERLHQEGVYHRDIAPDNIQIEPDGRPVLMDFGAARRVLTDKTQSLTAILKPAYAPIEQYAEAGAVRQGPWTDLYALGATLHYMLIGRPPAPATARTVDDEQSLLTAERLPRCSEPFLLAVQWMLRPRPADRPQSVAQLREVLEGRAAAPSPPAVAAGAGDAAQATPASDRTQISRPTADRSAGLASAADTTHVLLDPEPAAQAARPPSTDATVRLTARPAAPARESPAPQPAKAVWVLGGLGVLGAAAAWAWMGLARGPATTELPSASAGASAAVATVSTAAADAAASAPPVASASAAAMAASPGLAAPVSAAPVSAAPGVAATNPASAAGLAAATSPMAPAVGLPSAAGAKAPDAAQPSGAPSTRPTQTPTVAAAARPDAPAKAAPAAAKPVRPSAPAQAAVPTGPGPDCGVRDGVRYLVCMERECASAAFARHPTCERMRQ